jgi:hypothetical protein
LNELYESYEEELQDFLLAYFTQDIESPEEALQEFLESVTEEDIKSTAECIRQFLNSQMSDQEKANFIEENCFIDFEYLKQNPIDWLKEIEEKMNDRLKNA